MHIYICINCNYTNSLAISFSILFLSNQSYFSNSVWSTVCYPCLKHGNNASSCMSCQQMLPNLTNMKAMLHPPCLAYKCFPTWQTWQQCLILHVLPANTSQPDKHGSNSSSCMSCLQMLPIVHCVYSQHRHAQFRLICVNFYYKNDGKNKSTLITFMIIFLIMNILLLLLVLMRLHILIIYYQYKTFLLKQVTHFNANFSWLFVTFCNKKDGKNKKLINNIYEYFINCEHVSRIRSHETPHSDNLLSIWNISSH